MAHMEYKTWFRSNIAEFCRSTGNITDLLRYLYSEKLISRTENERINNEPAVRVQCDMIYAKLESLGAGVIGKIIICLRASDNDHVADMFSHYSFGAPGTIGAIRDLLLADPTAAIKWPCVVQRAWNPNDVNRLRQEMQVDFAKGVLTSLGVWSSYRLDISELVLAMRRERMHNVADQITARKLGITPESRKRSRFVFQIGDEVYNFTGRESELEIIDSKMTRLHQVCITGLGGVGKSALARNYANRYFFNGNIVWVPAESEKAVKACFQIIRKKLGLPLRYIWASNADVAKVIYRKLETRCQMSIVIFDNVRQMEHIESFLPTSSNYSPPSVLITSRRRTLLHASEKCFQLQPLNPRDAVDLIRGKLEHPSDDSVKQLAETLGRLPLAIQQAIHHIAAHDLQDCKSVTIYLADLAERGRELLHNKDFLKILRDYSSTPYDTWDGSLLEIENSECGGGKLAIQLFNLLSYLNPHAISMILLGDMHPDEREWRLSLKLLEESSMVALERILDEFVLRINCLVQSVTRLNLAPVQECEMVLKLLTILTIRAQNGDHPQLPLEELDNHFSHLFPFLEKHHRAPSAARVLDEIQAKFSQIEQNLKPGRWISQLLSLRVPQECPSSVWV